MGVNLFDAMTLIKQKGDRDSEGQNGISHARTIQIRTQTSCKNKDTIESIEADISYIMQWRHQTGIIIYIIFCSDHQRILISATCCPVK